MIFVKRVYKRVKSVILFDFKLLKGGWKSILIDNKMAEQAALNGVIDQLPELTIDQTSNTYLLFAQPKSASLYILQLFSKVFNSEVYRIGFNEGNGDFYFPRVVGAFLKESRTISHSHSPANKDVFELIKKTDPCIIISYRNLADSIVSRKDMLVKNGWASQIISKKVTNEFDRMTNDELIDLTIDLYAAEYLNFYTSWIQNKTDKTFFIEYDSFIQDQSKTFKDLSLFFNLSFDNKVFDSIKNAIDKKGGVNKNIGKIGRSKDELNDYHKRKLSDLAKKFKIEDSSFLGL